MTIEIVIERDGAEVIAECSFTCYKATRGHCDKYGAPEEPDEPASCEFESAIDLATGKPIELTDSEITEAEEKAIDNNS